MVCLIWFRMDRTPRGLGAFDSEPILPSSGKASSAASVGLSPCAKSYEPLREAFDRPRFQTGHHRGQSEWPPLSHSGHEERALLAAPTQAERRESVGIIRNFRRAARFYYLDTWSAARCEKVEHPLPVIRRPEIKTKYILVSGPNLFLPCETPDLGVR